MKKNVLLISTHSDESGAPRHVENLIYSLQDSVNYIGYISGDQGPVFKRIESSGIKCIHSRMLKSEISFISDLICFCHILFVCWRLNPDILHVHSAKASLIGRLVAFCLRIKCIYTVHGWGWRGMSPVKGFIIKSVERLVGRLKNCSFIAVSESVRSEGIAELGICPQKIVTIFNGLKDVDKTLRSTSTLTNPFKLIMPARVCKAKDHETLIKAFAKLPDSYQLILCGEGTDSECFLRFTSKFAGSALNRIIFLGQRSNIEYLISQAHILILSSHFEALPLSLIEGLRAGLPIIGTDVGGVSEIITPTVGELVTGKDVAGLTSAIEKISYPPNYEIYSINARERFEAVFKDDKMRSLILCHYNI